MAPSVGLTGDVVYTGQSYHGLTRTDTNRKGQTETKLHNAAGWVMRSTDNANTPVNFTYWPFGELMSTDVNNDLSTRVYIGYDNLGRRTWLDDPNTGVIHYRYNALGLLAQQTDAKGQVTRYTYDLLGRKISRTDDATGSSATHTWTYDTAEHAMGQLARVTGINTDGTSYQESYSYTANGLPATVQTRIGNQSFTLSQQYDNHGRPLALTYPGGFRVANIYNAYGQLSQVVAANDKKRLWIADEADASGALTQFRLGDGTVTQRDYDARTGYITAIRAERSGVTLQNHTYAFDAVGNLTRREDLKDGFAQSFCYDGLNRLVAARLRGCSSHDRDYEYDALGNILKKDLINDYRYGQHAGPHAVTQADGNSYFYDANGSLVRAENANGDITRWVEYSAFNKPTRITNDSAWSEVVYSPNKNRIKRRDSTGRETLYVGAHYEQTTWGGITTRLHRIGDFAVYIEQLGLQQGSYIQYLHRDHLGSIVAKTSDKEPDLERLANSPWGERRFWAWDGPADPHYDPVDNRGFTGHEHLDPVGLIHMNGRVYDPELGRFLSPDPFVQAPFNTQSYNRYTYAFNNPLSLTDPSGYTSERCGYGTVNNKCAGGLNEADLNRIEEYEASKGGVDGEVVIRGSRWGNTVHTAFSGYYDVRDWQMSSGWRVQQGRALDSPVGGARISSAFGVNRTCNPCSSVHLGTDYAVPIGTNIVATADGIVSRAYSSATFGNTVIIDHGQSASGSGNVYTLYAHGDSLSVRAGQSVSMGQLIMLSGNTGNSTGPHLHYEVIRTTSAPNERSFFGNINERYAPTDLGNLIQ